MWTYYDTIFKELTVWYSALKILNTNTHIKENIKIKYKTSINNIFKNINIISMKAFMSNLHFRGYSI